MGAAQLPKKTRRRLSGQGTGQEDSHLLQALPKALGLDAAKLEEAAVATRQQVADAEEATARERFQPHIQVLASWPNGKRMPFFIQAFALDQKVLPLPDGFDRLSSSRQVRQVAGIVRAHFREHQGKLGRGGKITGYRVQFTYNHAVVLNIDGTIREGFQRRPETPAPELRVGGKRVPAVVFVGE